MIKRTPLDVALGLLARREHSRLDLQRKLLRKGFDLAEISPALDKLEEDNQLSEERFIEMFVHAKSVRGLGPLKIRAELQKQGVFDLVIAWEEETFVQSAIKARKKRFGERLPETQQEKWRQMRFLQQRGFTTEQIQAALSRHCEERSDEAI